MQLFWIITDNDVFWINPLLPPETTEQSNPRNGLLQNIQNGASLRVILRQVVAGASDNIIMAGNAVVIKTPVTNNAWTGVYRKTDVISRQVGAGQYLCGAMSSQQDVAYLGSDLGIGIEVNLEDLSLKRIFFAPGEQFLTVLFDTKGATFWSSNRGTVVRVNTADFTIFARETVPAVSNLQAATQDPSTGLITYGANFGTDFNTYTVLKTDCNYDCSRCLSFDRQYCGVCKATGLCTVNETCIISTSADLWEQSGTCPQSRSITPASANTFGGTVVTIQGTYFERASDHKCVFFSSETDYAITSVLVSASTATPPYVTCAVPSINQLTGVASISVGVRWGPQTGGPNSLNGTRDWGGVVPFQTYRCSAQNCDQCFSTVNSVRQFPECIWCVRSRTCSAVQACDNTFPDNRNADSCPTITNLSPRNGTAIASTPLTITLSQQLPAELNYACVFDSTSASATPSGNVITCNAPTRTLAGVATEISAMTIITTPANDRIVPRTVEYTYYNCSALQKCSDCLLYSTCSWCPGALACAPTVNINAVCGGSGVNQASQCPRPSQAAPPSVLQSDIGVGSTFQIQGANFESYGAGTCRWTNAQTGAFAFASTFTYGSAAAVTCEVPAGTPEGNYLVSVANNAIPQTDTVPFLVYTCNITNCVSCLDVRRTKCQWCNSGAVGSRLKCGVIGSATCSATAFTDFAECPVLTSSTPSGDSTDGNIQIVLSGDFLFVEASPTNVSCEFLNAGANATLAHIMATSANATTVVCTTPSVAAAGSTRLRLSQDLITYSNTIPFNFYNCSSASTCDSCLVPSLPNCRWCAIGCSSAALCPSARQVQSCPVLGSVTPNFTITNGGDIVTVSGGPFIPDDAGTYRCSIGGVDSAGRAASTTAVECTTPGRAVGPATVKIFLDGVDYTPTDESSIQYFACDGAPRSSSCENACFELNNAAYCGWCVSSATCTGQARCPDLWLDQCLIATFAENNNHASLRGNEVVTVNMAVTGANGRQFNEFLASDLICSFGSTYQLVADSIVRGADNTTTGIRCKTPAVPSDVTVQFTIYYKGGALFRAMPFTFVDCNRNEPRCETCLGRKPYCGWCLDGNDCTTRGTCYTNAPCNVGIGQDCTASTAWTNSICPRVISLLPRPTGDVAGGEDLTIIGENFVTGNRLYVAFNSSVGVDDFTVPATVTNSSYLTCKIPKGPAVTETSLTLRHRINATAPYKTFTTNTVAFAWVLGNQINFVGLGVGLGVGVLVIVGAIVGAAIYVRRKYRDALIVRVKEPNYTIVAFGSDMEAKYKMPEDSYKKLEFLLVRRDFGLQLAIQSFCPATEQDLVAKAMIHIAHTQDKAIDLINTLVRIEVAQCIQENTIFRGNSLVSKMFKFYSRIAGIKYLFRSIARVIAELETLGRKELHKKNKGDTGKKKGEASLLNMTMELDDNKLAKEGDVADVDLDTNILQLQLTCQKLFGVIVKSGAAGFPIEFRRIFVQIDQTVLARFGSNDAAFKAIGGFFFLRFVCPAITAPHVYGLLEAPPNELTQRQLVLISKVLQSLANMAVPGKKEKYMATLATFIESNIPKMGKFYDEIRKPGAMQGEPTDMEVPKDVKQNALGTLWGFIFLNQEKVQTAIYADNVGLEKTTAREVSDSLEELIYDYKTGPKKLESKKKGGAKPGATSAPIPDV